MYYCPESLIRSSLRHVFSRRAALRILAIVPSMTRRRALPGTKIRGRIEQVIDGTGHYPSIAQQPSLRQHPGNHMQKLIVALVFWCPFALASADNQVALKFVQSIPLPDVDGRMIHQIDGLAQPQGTLYLAEWDKLFVANSANGHVNVYDGTKFALIDTIDFGEGSDPYNLR